MKRIGKIYFKMFKTTALIIGIGNVTTSIYSTRNKNFMRENEYFNEYYLSNDNNEKLVNFVLRTFIICPLKSISYGVFSPIVVPVTILGFMYDPKRQFKLTFTPCSWQQYILTDQ